jgi:hypothetical protein
MGKFIATKVSYVVVHVLLIYFINLFLKKKHVGRIAKVLGSRF